MVNLEYLLKLAFEICKSLEKLTGQQPQQN